MDFFTGLVSFFTDKRHSISAKLFGIILIISTVFLINNLLGFTFYYSTNQKITQIEKIERLKRDTLLGKENFLFLNTMEEKLKKRENVFDKFGELFSRTEFNGAKEKKDSLLVEKTPTNIISGENATTNTEQSAQLTITRSRLWHTITSTFVFLIILIVVPFMPFIAGDFSKESLLAVIGVFTTTAFLIWLFQFLLGLIPLINNNAIYNYLINGLIQIFIGFLLIRYINKN